MSAHCNITLLLPEDSLQSLWITLLCFYLRHLFIWVLFVCFSKFIHISKFWMLHWNVHDLWRNNKHMFLFISRFRRGNESIRSRFIDQYVHIKGNYFSSFSWWVGSKWILITNPEIFAQSNNLWKDQKVQC